MFQKATKELQPAFMQKRLTLAHEQSAQPRNRVRGRLPVEMARHTREGKTGPLPLGIVQHGMEAAVSAVPTSMVILGEPFGIDHSPRD